MPHVVLLGDSVLDNGAYVRGGPDVVAQLRSMLPHGWTATLLAVDGATTAGVPAQARRIPRDATHLVLSAGGNDALAIFNDPIVRTALEHRLRLLDLRELVDEPADYANTIEPSVQGGAKIARAIARAVGAPNDARPGLR